MVYASIEHCPVFGATLISFDDAAAKKVKGVLQVETCERVIGKYRYKAVAVIAENYWAAYKGRKALIVKWDYRGNEKFNSKAYEQSLRELSKTEGVLDHSQGNFDGAFSTAAIKLEAFYETPIVSHSPIEPMNCVASWYDTNKLEIWASTQVPGGVVEEFPQAYGHTSRKYKGLIRCSTAGGSDVAYTMMLYTKRFSLRKKIGKPVKVIWTREDDTQQGPFRPMTFSAMKGALSAEGKVIAFQHKVISPSLDAADKEQYDKTKTDRTMTEGVSGAEVRNRKHEKHVRICRYTRAPGCLARGDQHHAGVCT